MQLYLKTLFLVNEMQFDCSTWSSGAHVRRMAQARLPFSFDGAALMKVTATEIASLFRAVIFFPPILT